MASARESARQTETAPNASPRSQVEVTLSPSVAAVRREVAGKPTIDSWDLVQHLLRRHPEYGGGRAAALVRAPGPARSHARSVAEWLQAVQEILEPAAVPRLHGRLLIVALCRLDDHLAEYLSADRFLDVVKAEITEPVDSLFIRPSAERPSFVPDPAPLRLDNPTVEDQLGRRGFARALAVRLGRIWDEYSRSGASSSFILHLHGPWGSGKTSLLNLLRRELQRPEGVGQHGRHIVSRWVVVDFNAWQLQRLRPPWWPLLDAVYRQAVDQIRQRKRGRRRALHIALREQAWRLFASRRDIVAAAAVALFVLAAAYLVLRVAPGATLADLQDVGKAAGAVKDVLAVVTAVASGLLIVSRSLLSGSSTAAQAFVQSGTDPMERVSRHFRSLVDAIHEPVVVFIDDLDRCNADYVVTLLEGIQTLFNDPRVIYVISADRRWIHACFENVYTAFVPKVNEPGRSLGSLFLEKAVQLSVSVPRLSAEVQAAYWDSLVQGQHAGVQAEQLQHAEGEVRREFLTSTSEADVFGKLADPAADPVYQQLRRQAAVERLASARVEQSTSYFLQPFAPLLEPNPRAMKRLLNGYAVHRDLAILAGIEVMQDEQRRRQLALWTVLSLRWPVLEEYLLEQVTGRNPVPTPEIGVLLASTAVQDVMNGAGVGATLDLPTIATLAGARPSDAVAGAVA